MYPVAPFMGAWIEMIDERLAKVEGSVAPFMGAWIEICFIIKILSRGVVAPFMGAWIEIGNRRYVAVGQSRRSLHGSVD